MLSACCFLLAVITFVLGDHRYQYVKMQPQGKNNMRVSEDRGNQPFLIGGLPKIISQLLIFTCTSFFTTVDGHQDISMLSSYAPAHVWKSLPGSSWRLSFGGSSSTLYLWRDATSSACSTFPNRTMNWDKKQAWGDWRQGNIVAEWKPYCRQ